MTFNSLPFVGFLVVVLALHRRLGQRGQNLLAVAASGAFYATFDVRYLALLWSSAGLTWWVGRALGATDDERRRRRLVALALVALLGVLAAYKYLGFFVDAAAEVLRGVGLDVTSPVLRWVLPVGISFYTFQMTAYVLTVARGKLEPEADLLTYVAFASWFPQVLAGPIERPRDLLAQFRTRRAAPPPGATEPALALLLQGLVKKVVVADGVAAYVNGVYADPGAHGALPVAFAAVGFAVQIYGDFSGYSDMARGVSRLFGIELRRNFEQPFLSRNIQELWQRWHTGLSWWFLEFVGTPLGRRRPGPAWSGFVTLVVFTGIGLWHGPAWTFIVWGAFNGALVVLWRRRPVPHDQDRDAIRLREAPRIASTFALFCAGAVVFRADGLGQAATVFRQLLGGGGIGLTTSALTVPLAGALVLALDLAERRRRIAGAGTGMTSALGTVARPAEVVAEGVLTGLSPTAAGAVAGGLVVLVALFSGGPPIPFIYFRF